jgi:hypothetical protein
MGTERVVSMLPLAQQMALSYFVLVVDRRLAVHCGPRMLRMTHGLSFDAMSFLPYGQN